MGCCVSIHKQADSAMKIRFSMGCMTKKETSIKGEHPVSVLSFKSQSLPTHPVTGFRDFGSKEETFFDSQAWLESDCEDDFVSVNGDFTPSRGNTPSCGNTPNRQSSFSGTQLNKSLFMDRAPNSKPEPSPSPTDKKKRLSELFQETFEVDEESEGRSRTNGYPEVKSSRPVVQSKSTSETPHVSGSNSVCSSERTPSRDSKPEKEKVSRTVQCCLPSFVPSRKSTEKKRQSPEKKGGG